MTPDATIVVHRRNGRYVFIARPYGVIVRADDLSSGLKELGERVQAVAEEYREAGVDPMEIADAQSADSPARTQSRAADPAETADRQFERTAPFQSQYLPFLIKTAVVAAFVVVILQIQLGLMSQYFGPGSTVGFIGYALRHPVQFAIQLGEKADQVPAARSEELRLAVRKIASKIGPLVEEFRLAVAQSESPPPSARPPAGAQEPSR